MRAVSLSTSLLGKKRVLLLSDHRGLQSEVQLALAFHEGRPGASSSSVVRAAEPSAGLSSFEIDCCSSDQDAADLVDRATATRSGYDLLVLDAALLVDKNPRAFLQRLWHFHRDLPVLIHAGTHLANGENLADEFGGSAKLLVIRSRLQPFELAQMIALLANRKQADGKSAHRDHDLCSQLFDLAKRFEDASARLHAEHEKRVRLEEQLARAHRMATVGRLADGLAHFINNQLTLLQGHLCTALAERDGSSRLLESLEEQQVIARRAADITAFLIAFNHRETQEPVRVNLVSAIDAASMLIKHVLGADITLEVTHGGNLSEMLVDQACLGQILMNLAMAAGDALPRGGTLSIRSHREWVRNEASHGWLREKPEEGEYMVLNISARGQELEIAKVSAALSYRPAEPFSEDGAESSQTLLQSLVSRLGGWMTVDYAAESGYEFAIFLPISDGGQIEEVRSQETKAEAEEEKATVLIVDDEDAVSQVMEYVLTSQGHRVLLAEDASAALQVWQDNRSHIKLAILDVQLPGGTSGFELQKALNEDEPALPVVFICGYTAANLREHKLVPGVNFLPKPFGMSELLNIVGKALLREVPA